jgi:hypothetical protein
MIEKYTINELMNDTHKIIVKLIEYDLKSQEELLKYLKSLSNTVIENIAIFLQITKFPLPASDTFKKSVLERINSIDGIAAIAITPKNKSEMQVAIEMLESICEFSIKTGSVIEDIPDCCNSCDSIRDMMLEIIDDFNPHRAIKKLQNLGDSITNRKDKTLH